MVARYSPIGLYSGHWGVDYGAAEGSMVRAPASGRVTFAGTVAGMRTMTIEPVPGFKVSLSYLESVTLSAGQWVSRGQRVGTSGLSHGVPAVHLSTRIDGRYVDP
ncbi:MAG TPA: M23 family metallopeptidase, partial [Acidimicrobiia bacterium]